MTTSRIAAGIANALPLLFGFTLLAALGVGAPSLAAQQSHLVGKWSGVDRGTTLTVEFRPNGQYSQTAQSGTLIARQAGPYKIVTPNKLVFLQAKTQQHTAAVGAPGGHPSLQRADIPLGARSSFVFKGATRITMTDETTHRSIILVRQP
jgi:hypothetical protein